MIRIESGLFDRMILQRNTRNVCDANVIGSCAGAGKASVTVTHRGKAIRGVKLSGRASAGRFNLTLKGLKVGGPYDITLAIGSEQLTVCDVLVGDVWVLAGQSNMQGSGNFVHRSRPHRLVRGFFMDDQWRIAEDALHNMWDAVDEVHPIIAGGRPARPPKNANHRQDVGPGVAFGQQLYGLSGIPIGLLACAHGGTSMSQWNPQRRDEGGKSLYGATFRRVRKNGGRIAGVCWYQGESDANAADVALYLQRMKELIAAFRRDAKDSRLPFVLVQLGRHTTSASGVEWNQVQDIQRRLPAQIRHTCFVPAVDLELDDGIHIGGRDQQVLGKRLARAVLGLAGKRGGRQPITLRNIKTVPSGFPGGCDLLVAFDHVAGSLRSGGRPAGFFITDGSSLLHHAPFRVSLKGNTARLHVNLSEPACNSLQVQYGRGRDPYCNIHDAEGWPLPVFGPVMGTAPRALGPFAQSMRHGDVSDFNGSMRALALPKNIEHATPHTARATNNLLDLKPILKPDVMNDRLVFYRAAFTCAEPMKLLLWLGYNAPIKAWVDGKSVICDPDGWLPIGTDKTKGGFHVKAGQHTLVVALGGSNGKFWGVYARFERCDVTSRAIEQQTIVLPQWKD